MTLPRPVPLFLLLAALALPAIAQDATAPPADVPELAEETPPPDAGELVTVPTASALEIAPAPIVVPDPADAGSFAALVAGAISSRNWPLLAGLALTLLVWIARKVKLDELVGSTALPWITLALAFVGNMAASLLAGVPWATGLVQAILAAAVAMAGWDLSGIFRSSSTTET